MKYDFECEKCENIVELEMSVDDYMQTKDIQFCNCGGKMKRVYTPLMLTEYRCGGFYDTNSRSVSFR